jgi:hypothetical protein
MPGEGAPLRTLWLPDGDDLAAAQAARGSGLLLVEATLRRIAHPPITGTDGSSLPALVEYRLTGADVVGAVTAQDATPRRKRPSVPGPVASTLATEQQAVEGDVRPPSATGEAEPVLLAVADLAPHPALFPSHLASSFTGLS